jgi:HAD superfamily 5'-nucleotidase-like hydrolase
LQSFLCREKGLSYIVGEDWLDIFDVTVVSARKPHFFSDDSIPFRKYDPKQDARLWDKVNELEKGQVYYGGTLKQFQKLTGWSGDKVVYFGDHAYTDLADVTLHHGWRTGAIIKELEVCFFIEVVQLSMK